jgi:purine-nucleoside phosphorylase
MLDNFKETVDFLRDSGFENPEFALILGSGLGNTSGITIEKSIPYSEIPGFPVSTVEGHKGMLLFGTVGEKKVVIQQGRFHFYEGYSGEEVIFGLRVMKLLGAHTLLVSNAAGGINPTYKVGDLMLIQDHINMLPNPLIGKNDDRFGPRFPDMTHVYNKEMIQTAGVYLSENNYRFHQGIYYAGTGPSFETQAEYKFMRIIGADAVGMSTTPEVIAAKHAGMRVFGVSVITNEAYNFADDFENDGADVITAAKKAAKKISGLFKKLIVDS